MAVPVGSAFRMLPDAGAAVCGNSRELRVGWSVRIHRIRMHLVFSYFQRYSRRRETAEAPVTITVPLSGVLPLPATDDAGEALRKADHPCRSSRTRNHPPPPKWPTNRRAGTLVLSELRRHDTLERKRTP